MELLWLLLGMKNWNGLVTFVIIGEKCKDWFVIIVKESYCNKMEFDFEYLWNLILYRKYN